MTISCPRRRTTHRPHSAITTRVTSPDTIRPTPVPIYLSCEFIHHSVSSSAFNRPAATQRNVPRVPFTSTASNDTTPMTARAGLHPSLHHTCSRCLPRVPADPVSCASSLSPRGARCARPPTPRALQAESRACWGLSPFTGPVGAGPWWVALSRLARAPRRARPPFRRPFRVSFFDSSAQSTEARVSAPTHGSAERAPWGTSVTHLPTLPTGCSCASSSVRTPTLSRMPELLEP